MRYFSMLFLFFLAISCQKENDESANKGVLKFGINPKLASALKSALVVGNPSFILVDIEGVNGETVQSYLKLELYSFQETFISKPFALEPGNYKLTNFLVMDSEGNTLYAAPKEGSKLAYLVNDPLDIEFEISTDVVTLLNPEVLSTETLTASDFGYFDASFSIVKTFDFLVTTVIFNDSLENFELTNSSITISNGSVNLLAESLLAATNQITLNESIEFYTIVIEKNGYKTFSATLSTDSLKRHFQNPWVVVLEKFTPGMLAYYPFNGNANDESDNGYNGIVNGALLTTDRHGNANSAYLFDGYNSFIELPNTLDMLPRTIDLWLNSSDFDYSYSYGGILQTDYPDLFFGNTGIAVKEIDGVKKLLLTISAVTDTFDLAPDTWYNVAMVANSSKEISFYIDGNLLGRKTFTDFMVSVNGLNKIILGAGRLASQNYFSGMIDDVRIYSKALSQAEVEQIFNGHEIGD